MSKEITKILEAHGLADDIRERAWQDGQRDGRKEGGRQVLDLIRKGYSPDEIERLLAS